MIPPSEKKCHHTAFEKSCRSLVANGICDRWKNLPGPTPFKMDAKPSEWGCVDDMVWYVAGEAAVQGHGGHQAITQFREMVINRPYRERQLAQENAETPKAIEAQS
jgi:hypothetical protein